MKIYKKVLITFLSLLVLVGTINAQPKPSNQNPTVVNNNGISTAEADRRRATELLPGQENALRQLGNTNSANSDNEINLNAIKERNNLRIVKANVVLVPKEYSDKYNVSGNKNKLQLAKILNSKCNDGKVVLVADIEKCANSLQIWGGGSFYSFRNQTNYNSEAGIWADIRLYDGKFVVGNNTAQGIISRLGDVNFDDIKLASSEMKFLKDYQPKKKVTEINKQKDVLKSGINENGFFYSVTTPVEINSTYVLRSIAYQTGTDEPADNRADIILAFKVVGIEKDGNVIILWKELRKDEAPQMKD